MSYCFHDFVVLEIIKNQVKACISRNFSKYFVSTLNKALKLNNQQNDIMKLKPY